MLLLISEELNHIVEKTEKLANKIMDKIEGNSLSLSRFQILAHLIFGRSVTSFCSTKLLAKEGYGFDAMVIVRTIVENLITLEYINLEPDYRAQLFYNYIHVIKYRRLQNGKLLHKGSLISYEQESKIKENYYRVEGCYPNKHSWSGKPLRNMAEEVSENMPWIISYYLLPYVFGSSYVHGNIDALFNYFEETEAGIKIRGGAPSPKETNKALVTAVISLMTIVQRVCEILNCDVPEEGESLIQEILNFLD